MPSVPNAGSRDHFTLASAPSPRTQARRRRTDAAAERIFSWLSRLATAAGLIAYAAKMMQVPFAGHMLIAALVLFGLVPVAALLIQIGKYFHLFGQQVLKDKAPACDRLSTVRDTMRARPPIEADAAHTAENAVTGAPTYAVPTGTHKLTIRNLGTITYRIATDDDPADRK